MFPIQALQRSAVTTCRPCRKSYIKGSAIENIKYPFSADSSVFSLERPKDLAKKSHLLMAQEAAKHCGFNMLQLLKVIANTGKDVGVGKRYFAALIIDFTLK